MTPEQQRIKIAEACGWFNCVSPIQDEYHFLTDLELGLAMGNPVGRNLALHNDGLHHPIPDYLNDLNAMHEAEKVLTESQQSEFADRLNSLHKVADLTYPEPNMRGFRKDLFSEAFHLIHTTAAQRAEAFLRTFNLWEE